MFYKHPFFELGSHHISKGSLSSKHTMGDSLERYCEIKVHNLLKSNYLWVSNNIEFSDVNPIFAMPRH